MAFSRLCAPRRRISSAGSGSSPNSMRRAAARHLHPGRHDRHLLRRLVREHAQLRLAVGLEAAVTVEVVLGHVQQQRGVGGERLRVLGLEARHLADDRGRLVHLAHQRRERRSDVPGERHRQVRLAPDRSQQLRGRGLAVRARDRHERGSAAAARPARARRAPAAPRSRAATITGASFGTPGLFTTQATRSSSSTPSTPRCASRSPGTSGLPESVPITSPWRASMRAAAIPERASPTTRYGPSGRGGLTGLGSTPGRA